MVLAVLLLHPASIAAPDRISRLRTTLSRVCYSPALEVQCLIGKTVLEHLAQAEQHAIEGAARIERLETMIADLDRKGRDIRDAKAILATMRVTQTHNEGDCLSLLKQLQRYTEPSPDRFKNFWR